MELDEAQKDELIRAERMIIEEKKWVSDYYLRLILLQYREVIQKVDIVPDEINYYEKLAVKPGFDFIYALINCDSSDLETLRINIPETLFFNYNTYLVSSDTA